MKIKNDDMEYGRSNIRTRYSPMVTLTKSDGLFLRSFMRKIASGLFLGLQQKC